MRQRRLPTRKKRAIRQIAIAIAALLLVNHILDVGLLLPVQAVWKVKESMCMDPMRVVARDHAPELGNTELTYLMTNENAMVITSVQLTALGWQCPGGAMFVEFDQREGAPLYGIDWYVRGDPGQRVNYFFGWVDDPRISTVTAHVIYKEGDRELGQIVRTETLQLTASEFYEAEGRRFFLLRHSGEWEEYLSVDVDFVALDSAGSEIARQNDGDAAGTYSESAESAELAAWEMRPSGRKWKDMAKRKHTGNAPGVFLIK